MASYNLGSAVELSTTVTDDTGTLADTTMALTVTAPDGTTLAPSPTHGTTGMYSTVIDSADLDQTGTWFYQWAGTGAVEVSDSGQFTILDPVPPTYATLAELKQRLSGMTNATDGELMSALRAASRRIDADTGRRFWRDQAATERVYDTSHPEILLVDDIATPDGVIVKIGRDPTFTVVPTMFWRLQPDACFAKQKPAYVIKRRPYAPWPLDWQAKVTAVWGWPLLPEDIHEACLLLAGRLYSRKESITGLAGFNDLGPVRISRTDSDYDALVSSYVRPEV